jgi:hypothetical protein
MNSSRQDLHRKFMSGVFPALVAFLTTCTILTSGNTTVAQEIAGRSALSDSADPLNPETLSGPVPQPVLKSTAGTRPSAVSHPSTVVKRRTAATAISATQVNPGPDVDSSVGGNPAIQPDTWQQEYSSHVNEVLTGDPCYSERGTVGDWWRHRLPNVYLVPVRPRRLQTSARNFVNEHTLPPEHDYDVDVYDQKPISVASSRSVTNVRPVAAQPDDAQVANEPGKNRLRTDIRKIRPTLSYAMRNIEPGQLPEGFDEKLDGGEYVARQASPAVLQWAPTNLYHYPLYFEDPSLERYGHTYHPLVQPFASAGRFATQLVGLPYQMTLHPVHAHEYTLGYYRPGECAPKKHYQIPFNEEAAIMQAAAMAGFFLIFP